MRTLRKVLTLVAAFFTVAIAVVLVNQSLQLAMFAERFHPIAGDAVFWGLIFFFVGLVVVPVALFLRLPGPLVPPESEDDPSFPTHVARLRERLARNPSVRDRSLESVADVEAALKVLDARAEAAIRAAGSRAFLTTAVSQNGALDAVIVLGIQSKLVWDIAQAYEQRPSLRSMTWLYTNVAATAFLAGELDDADLAEIVQPVLSTVLGSAASAVPGLQVASTVFTTSVISGTANAFLTLRVGVIAQEYSRALLRPARRTLRRAAMVRATGMLGAIVGSGAGRVAGAITRATGRSMSGAITGVGRRMRDAGEAMAARVPFRRATDPGGGEGGGVVDGGTAGGAAGPGRPGGVGAPLEPEGPA